MHGFSIMVIIFAKIFALLCVLLLYGILPSTQAEKHSLYYIYTVLSKPVNLSGIYEFTAVGLLDDTQIDYYNSEEKRKIPKQQWMKEKLQEDYWERGTQSRKSKEEWFNVSVKILRNRMNQSESDLHVLQWRHGCEVEQQGDEVKFLKGIDEYSYDGENFLSFDIKKSRWVAAVDAALPTKRKWYYKPELKQISKAYLETKCVDWLNKFREYGDEELRKTSPPDVHLFAKRYIKYKTKLKLTCMATGFYHKDLMMNITKNHISLPEHEIESTGIRPNHDGSFQMSKSVEIKEGDERADYYCLVSHKSLKEPIINKWDGKCWDCLPEIPTGAMIGFVIGAELVLAAFCFLFFKWINGRESIGEISDVNIPVPEQLLKVLNELDSDNKKRFKWHLKQRGSVSASFLENADNMAVVDQMVNSFTPNGALMLTVDILKMMKQNHLAEQLIQYLNSDVNIKLI
ncbi:H-2 class I histocompatibility antigen, Q10 alpha chain-like isoform X2 [Ctenopharyngodon idella]|uniref:H-2 class I histocompatibility antigen, Q10 alpha chain-like isoform X2 n=1 Tax=Ctenopharyngodon idella TaxID=7959 RepID=UPI00223297F3|nr:H-2 class I histocompatibility antigen, Q10 alpha chain-like isoform X2 [Ctenopharyngodon idella]